MLSLSSWLVLAASLAFATLAARAWLEQAQPPRAASVAAATPSDPITPAVTSRSPLVRVARAASEQLGRHAVVSGVLRGRRGEPVASETVQLRSRALAARYSGVSDAAGAFLMPGVLVGGDYDFAVRPRGPYADYSRHGIEVAPEGVELEVALEPLPTRRVAGRMLDADGGPVPGFRLWLRGDDAHKKSVAVRGDDAGRFQAEGVPLGRLSFAASSATYVMLGKAQVEEGAPVDLVIDAGERRLEGRALSPRGEPIAGAQLELRWLHRDGTQQSRATRRAVSDTQGRFRFDGLGPGPHRVTASAAGEDSTSPVVEVPAHDAAVLEVVLEPSPAR
jgi:hypothetical protein